MITLLLIAPVLMLTSATPAVSIAADGIMIQPRVWRERFVAWADVRAVKDYPLLPPRDAEVTRRAMVGKKRYRAAEGKMLIIPSLPLQYRFTGLFAGEGFTGVIALTNRSHTNYDALIKQVEKHVTHPRPLSTVRRGESVSKSLSPLAWRGIWVRGCRTLSQHSVLNLPLWHTIRVVHEDKRR